MDIKGNATADKVRGKINDIDVLCLSAYAIAVKHGFEGTEEEWLLSLKGEKGDQGIRGESGKDGIDGKDGKDAVIDQNYNPESENAQSGKAVAEAFGELAKVTTYEESKEKTETINPTLNSGFVGKDGTVYSGGGLVYTNKVAVSGGDIITVYRNDGVIAASARFVTFYNGNTAVTKSGLENVTFPLTVPEGVDGVVITISDAFVPFSPYITKTTETTVVKQLFEKFIKKTGDTLSEEFDLNANGEYALSKEFQNMHDYRISFRANVAAFSGVVKIHKGTGATGGVIGLDKTNIYYYHAGATEPTRTQPHGLTLTDYISVTIAVPIERKATVTVSTGSGRYVWNLPYYNAPKGLIKVTSECALTRCRLSYRCSALNNPIWLYGDSYFEYPYTQRWTYYLVNDGYCKFMLNAFPGRGSVEALAMLKNDLSLGFVPTIVVWCMGMNNGDSATEINSDWITAVQEVISICEENKIKLYLSTIPTTPTINNSFKNEYVLNSDVEYVDFAGAIDGFEGMISDDNVHPTTNGAIALYTEIVGKVTGIIDGGTE